MPRFILSGDAHPHTIDNRLSMMGGCWGPSAERRRRGDDLLVVHHGLLQGGVCRLGLPTDRCAQQKKLLNHVRAHVWIIAFETISKEAALEHTEQVLCAEWCMIIEVRFVVLPLGPDPDSRCPSRSASA